MSITSHESICKTKTFNKRANQNEHCKRNLDCCCIKGKVNYNKINTRTYLITQSQSYFERNEIDVDCKWFFK